MEDQGKGTKQSVASMSNPKFNRFRRRSNIGARATASVRLSSNSHEDDDHTSTLQQELIYRTLSIKHLLCLDLDTRTIRVAFAM